jgi:hypothetical protein
MHFNELVTYLWIALGLLLLGSIYLIVEGYNVHKLFAESIVGRLVKTLVVVLLIEIYSLGIVLFVIFSYYPKGTVVVLPIVVLWLVTLVISIFSVRSAKHEVTQLIK